MKEVNASFKASKTLSGIETLAVLPLCLYSQMGFKASKTLSGIETDWWLAVVLVV